MVIIELDKVIYRRYHSEKVVLNNHSRARDIDGQIMWCSIKPHHRFNLRVKTIFAQNGKKSLYAPLQHPQAMGDGARNGSRYQKRK